MKNELTGSLKKLFERDLDKLAVEMNLYSDEKDIWRVRGETKNTAGNLCLHLCGNLQHYVGVGLGKSEYVRNREKEFSERDVSREDLLKEIAKTKATVSLALENFESSLLDATYPLPVFDYPMTNSYFLLHLLGHLNYHLGQINYHRRMMDRC